MMLIILLMIILLYAKDISYYTYITSMSSYFI
jgi:hypothetical protein